jgi:hypothetical protein
MADPEFGSAKEFRTVIDQIFTTMSEDPEMGPSLRDADRALPGARRGRVPASQSLIAGPFDRAGFEE